MATTAHRGLAATDIRCSCGHVRTVSHRQARQWREGVIPGTCATCRGRSPTRIARDRDVGYWLRLYGVDIPRGQTARQVIAASGIPPDLAEFAKDCFTDP